jgi:O-antigen/teichoic acid export membrane protein
MSVRKNLYWAFLQEYSVFIINFISSIIIARLLKPDETGVYALSFMLVAILMQLRQFGMGTYVVQTKDLDPERAASALGVMYVISWALGIIILLSSGLIANYYHEPRLKPALLVLTITFFVAPVYQLGMALMERRMEFARLLRITLVSTLVTFCVSVGSAAYGLSHMALPFGYVSYVLTSCIMVIMMKPDGNIFVPKLKQWREVLGFGSYTSGAGLVGTIGRQIPEAVLGKLSGVTIVGLYNRASSLSAILNMLIVNAITRTVNVSLAQCKRDGIPLGPDYLNAVGLATGLGWSAFALLAIVAKPVIQFLYGDNWISAAPFLSFICIYQMMILSLIAYAEMMTLNGAFKRLFVYELGLAIFAFLNFLFWARIDPHYGAAGRSLEGIFFFLLYSFMLTRLLHIKYGDLARIYFKSFLLAGITIVPALAVSLWLQWPAKLSFLALAAIAIASAMFWIAGLFIVRHPLAPHLRPILQQINSKLRARKS